MSETENSSDFAELDQDPHFQTYLLEALQIKLFIKKFGEEFWQKYGKFSFRKALEDEEGEVQPPQTQEEWDAAGMRSVAEPLILEVGKFEEQVYALNTPEKSFAFAQANGLEFTPEEIRQAREDALAQMALDAEPEE